MRLKYLFGFFFILPFLTIAQKPEPGFTLKPLEENPVIVRQFKADQQAINQQIQELTGNNPANLGQQKAGCPNLIEGTTYVVSGDTVLLNFESPFYDSFALITPPSVFGTFTLDKGIAVFEANPGLITEFDTLLVQRCNTGSDPYCDTVPVNLVIKRPNISLVEPTQPWQPNTMGTYCIPMVDLPGTLNCGKLVDCPDPYEGEGRQLAYFTTYDRPDFCVVYNSSYFPGTDTVCVVYCDENTVCDTVKIPFLIEGDTLSLPFIDDFSYRGPYPDTERWLDDDVFVNATMAKDPVSWGVATFDGLSKAGTPYGGNFGVADYLTSKHINLEGFSISSNIILSFFAQPRGLGFIPLSRDSFAVEFKDKDGNWNQVFARPGVDGFIPLDSFPAFTFHAVGVSDPKYFHKGFQFRFKNKNDRRGAYANWNLDYVRIRSNGFSSPEINDQSLTQLPSKLLKSYTAMPFIQISGFEEKELTDNYKVHLNNLDGSARNVTPGSYEVENILTGDNFTNGLNNDLLITNTVTQPDLPASQSVFYNNPLDPGLPSNIKNGLVGESKAILRFTYKLDHTDEVLTRTNNTCYTDTDLTDYYAYDDGVAEGALELNGNGSMIMVRFEANVTDSLRGVMFHFPHVNGNVQDQIFNLIVQVGPLDTFSREVTYTRTLLRPYYPDNNYDTLQGFTTYGLFDPIEIDKPIALEIPPGEFYVGWQQGSSAANPIPVGFDKNNENGTKDIFQNTGLKWESLSKFPFIRGALMVRPIFGNTRPLPTRVVETPGSNSDLNVFPNPTSGQINFELPYGKLEDFEVSVFNSLGQMVMNQALNENGIQLSAQEEGMYILQINNTQTREVWTKKIIKF
jgi:hypothetical protein